MLFRFIIILTAMLCSLPVYAASGLKNVELHDLYFGEVLYYAYQDRPFEALARLDNELSQYYELDERELDSLHFHLGQAEFSVGDLELQYRMNQRAGKAIQAVLGDGLDLATRNIAALQLARLYYRKDDPESTLYALDLIRENPDKSRYEEKYSLDNLRGKPPETFKTDVAYLRALALIDTGQFSKAVDILQELREEKSLKGFVLYNLGIALIQSGREEEAMAVLDELGRLDTDDRALLALKDKTNLKLAYRYLDRGDAKKAQMYFERIRLDGPFSNRALLGAGWVAAAQGRFDRALVPWSILHKRSVTNDAVQEALMAVPYAYSKLEAYGNAANLYDHAMDVFAAEIDSLDSSIKSIRKGRFLTALLNEKADKDKNWVVNLRELPDTPETRYILELMASNDFQEMYKNYKDLAELRHHIDKWLADLRVFEEMIEIRRKYQEPLLPVVEEQFKKIDARVKLRLEQRNNLASKLKNLLIAPRPEYLATATERQALDTVMALEEIIKARPEAVDAQTLEKVRRMRGILLWRVRSEYDQRLTDAYNNLIALDRDIDKMKLRYNSFIRTRQAATQSYEGYTIPIRQLRTRLFAAQRKLKGTMAKQGRMLETMAINELDRRRKRLEEYQIKARFALAENYDRATKAQFDEELMRQRKLRGEAAEKQAQDAAKETAPENAPADTPQAPDEKSSVEEAPADRPAVKKPSSFKQKLLSP
ncbi:MAG TPA: tetratricopeptide repeat protein [Gammaproteobacteria bacterium]|nr:tetratricopeptide repeat protein [Gammaproteobacteria bacterium]